MTLPTVGGSENTWGTILNAHINVGHSASGSHNQTGLTAQVVNIQTGAVATGSTVSVFDDTIPQKPEGTVIAPLETVKNPIKEPSTVNCTNSASKWPRPVIVATAAAADVSLTKPSMIDVENCSSTEPPDVVANLNESAALSDTKRFTLSHEMKSSSSFASP